MKKNEFHNIEELKFSLKAESLGYFMHLVTLPMKQVLTQI